MAKMKIEARAAWGAKHGTSLREKLVAYMPRYAGAAGHVGGLLHALEQTPVLGAAVKKTPQESSAEPPIYSPLWDKLTNQIGITSPVAKSTIHLVLDQLMNKWLSEQAIVKTEKKAEKIQLKASILDHSLNHF
jgi:hypothetical protein